MSYKTSKSGNGASRMRKSASAQNVTVARSDGSIELTQIVAGSPRTVVRAPDGARARVVKVTRAHVAAAQLREAVEERRGEETPEWVKKLARLQNR